MSQPADLDIDKVRQIDGINIDEETQNLIVQNAYAAGTHVSVLNRCSESRQHRNATSF